MAWVLARRSPSRSPIPTTTRSCGRSSTASWAGSTSFMPRCSDDPARRMSVISIQSQVAYGHVGNSAAVFPMQMHGIDVVAVPTTLLSNRPGYPTLRGRVLDAQLVADLLLGIEERGAVDGCRMILSGYLGSPEIAAVVADFVARARARNPSLLYCCDPVLGDRDRGLFVHAAIPPLV